MIKNKKGLSAIVGTLLIILLVIAAVGIVWAVLRGTIQGGADDIGLSDQCLKISIKPTSVEYLNDIYTITYEREAGGADIAGVKLIVSNSTDAGTHTVSGNLAPFGKKTVTVEDNEIVVNATKVKAIAYLLDSEGNDYVCPTTNEYNL